MTDVQKYILEGFCKCVILEALQKTSKKDNKNLQSYVLNTMTLEQAFPLVFGKKILTEDMTAISAEREVAMGSGIKSTAQALEPILQLGFAIAAGGKIMGAAIQLGTKVGVGATGGVVGGILASMGMSFGLSLLSKVVQYAFLKLLSPCGKMCDRKFSFESGIMARGELVAQNKLCKNRCRVMAYNKIINELKRQLGNCERTENPSRCMSGINTQLAKYQKQLADLMDAIKKNEQDLAKAKQKAAST